MLAVKAGADVIILDGMQGGTAATQSVFIEHVGIPTMAAVPQAVEALQEMVERRRGTETGIAAVQCLEGDAVWKAGDEGLWPRELAKAAAETGAEIPSRHLCRVC